MQIDQPLIRFMHLINKFHNLDRNNFYINSYFTFLYLTIFLCDKNKNTTLNAK